MILALVCCLPILGIAGKAKFEAPADVQREAAALIGTEYQMGGIVINPDLSCTEWGGGFLYDKNGHKIAGWGVDFADCQGYLVLMLTQTVKVNEHRIVRLRVVDTVATPAITSDDPVAQEANPIEWVSAASGYCNVDRKQKSVTSRFDSFLLWDKKGRASGRKGQIKLAYQYDLKRQRIVPFDVKRLDCERDWFGQ